MTPDQPTMAVADVDVERCHGDVIRRVRERHSYVLNGVESHVMPGERVYYECPECGRRLKVLNAERA